MKLSVFASGSGGNCSLIQAEGRGLLLDAGISARRIRAGLGAAGLGTEGLAGILITHEHSDHVKGLTVFLKQNPVPVYAPGAVADILRRSVPGAAAYMHDLTPQKPLDLAGFKVTAFPTPHDACQSVGYRLAGPDGGVFALATDTGCVTDMMLAHLSGADMVLIEANHDVTMLKNGPYPPSLKGRILSARGHLSNLECAWLASVLAQRGTGTIVIGHMSKQNNDPGLALRTVMRGLEGTDAVLLAAPEAGLLEVECRPCCV